MEKEKFIIQGLEFVFKEATMDRQLQLMKLDNRIKKYILDKMKDAIAEVAKYSEDEKSVQYVYAAGNLALEEKLILAEWYYNENNMRELFTLLLDGDLDKIDYNKDADEIVNLGAHLTDRFFFGSNNLLKNTNNI